MAGPAKAQAGEEYGGDGPQRLPAVHGTEQPCDDENRDAAGQALGCAPEHFTGDDVIDFQRRGEDRLIGALRHHAREHRIHAFEAGGGHRRGGDDARGEEGQIRHA